MEQCGCLPTKPRSAVLRYGARTRLVSSWKCSAAIRRWLMAGRDALIPRPTLARRWQMPSRNAGEDFSIVVGRAARCALRARLGRRDNYIDRGQVEFDARQGRAQEAERRVSALNPARAANGKQTRWGGTPDQHSLPNWPNQLATSICCTAIWRSLGESNPCFSLESAK
jgi:hypothetical protein